MGLRYYFTELLAVDGVEEGVWSFKGMGVFCKQNHVFSVTLLLSVTIILFYVRCSSRIAASTEFICHCYCL